MLVRLRRLLSYRIAVGEVLVAAVLLGAPYLLIGAIWSSTHTDHLDQMAPLDSTVSYLGSIVSWPVLVFTDVCMT